MKMAARTIVEEKVIAILHVTHRQNGPKAPRRATVRRNGVIHRQEVLHLRKEVHLPREDQAAVRGTAEMIEEGNKNEKVYFNFNSFYSIIFYSRLLYSFMDAGLSDAR